MTSTIDLDRALDVAREAVAAGGSAALPWHRKEVRHSTKEDDSPVTEADRASDAAMLSVIRGAFADHDILSEESGVQGPGGCDCRWVVDPLDGTRGFLRGDEAWGPLVALEYQGRPIVAAMSLPVHGVTYWAARGRGTFRDGERMRVSAVDRWQDATLVVGFLQALLRDPWGPGVLQLIRSADRVRCPGDLTGPIAVIEGRADAWIEAGVREWDLAAPRLLVEEAGGRFSDLVGGATHTLGNAVGSNGLLHGDVLAGIRNG
jgi:histidinol-phosphatase